MNIAGKLTVIAENESKVYDAGYDNGYRDYYDFLWDTIQNKGGEQFYRAMFASFPAELYNPKYDFKHSKYGSAYLMFNEFKGTDIIKDNDFTKAYGDGLNHTFWNCPNLVNARTLTVASSHPFTNTFNACPKLEEVRFKGTIAQTISFGWSPLLSKSSIVGDVATAEEIAAEQNIITLNGVSYYKGIFGALSDATSGITATFKKEAIDNAFETSEDVADGSASGEWAALIAAKSNWTIALA